VAIHLEEGEEGNSRKKLVNYSQVEDFEVNDRFNTVAGLIINQSSTLPKVGDKITFENYILEIVDKDGQRIDKVLVTKLS
jgi:putative hemolysin